MSERAHIIARGRVQRGGYRDIVDRAAFRLGLTGHVMNLEDGTVEIVCEGERPLIEELMESIRIDEYPIQVKDLDVTYSPATDEFSVFEIIRGDDLARETYDRMDIAADYLRSIFRRQDESLNRQDQMLGKQDQMLGKQDATIGAIDNLADMTATRFDGLDEKYGVLGERMSSMEQGINGIGNDIHEMKDAFITLVDHVTGKKEED